MATEDASLAYQYAACQEKHSKIVDLWNEFKAKIDAYAESLKAKIP